jgi:iron complex outermembrane receptor protein
VKNETYTAMSMSYRKPLTATIAVFLGLPAGFSQAQDATGPADTGTGEAVVITGSNIKRTDYEGPQTVVVFDRKKIDQSGAQTITQLLKRLPQNAGGFSESFQTGLSFSPGAAGASLRGLGVSSTLVLINGRRSAPFPFASGGTDSFVDLNSIPLSAVDRVEVLKEGASAVYGSDAIAGVINVILKENYSGGEEETYYGNTTGKDAAEVRQSFVSGISTERFHLMLTGNYYHQNSLASVDRSYAANADKRNLGGFDLRSSRGNPGTIFASSGDFAVPRGSNGRLGVNDFLPGELPDGNIRNRFNFDKYTELIPESERWGGLLTFGYNLTPHIEIFGEAGYQSVQTKTRIAPTPPDSAGDGLVVPASNPFNPFGEEVSFLWRSVENGPRRDTTETDDYRYLTGIKIKDLPNNWSIEGAVLYSESNAVDYSTSGYLGVAETQAALNRTDPKTALNVFGDGFGINNRRTLKGLVVHPRDDGLSYLWNYDIKASGDLVQLPAGALGLAFGAEYREESLSQIFSAPAGTIVGFGGAGAAGNRDVRSLYAEASIPVTSNKWNVPLLRALEFSIAERYDEYSGAGESAKPKFGFKWKPLDLLLIRGAYSEGFRAPSLPQLFTGQVNSFETVTNPRTGITNDVPETTGGNPTLKPENSYSYFIGGIIEPPFIKGLSIEADFYRIERRNDIGQPTGQEIVNGKAPGTVTYNANNEITNIGALYTNIGTTVVDGVDLDLNYKKETPIGTFTIDASVALINSFEVKSPGDPNQDLTDNYSDVGSGPEFKMVTSLFYDKGGFEAGVTVNYMDSYDDKVYADTDPVRKVGSWTTVDLQASYEWNYQPGEAPGNTSKDGKTSAPPVKLGLSGWRWWLDGTKMTVGCNNIGDVQPPFSNIEEGYDTATADPTGRFIYASLRKKFW